MLVIACILISILFAPLGCVALWNRYSYLSDGLVHSCLLASFICIVTGINIIISTILIASLFVIVTYRLRSDYYDHNAVIGLVANSMTAAAIILSSLYPQRVNINSMLLGDILFVSSFDVIMLSILTIFVLIVIKLYLHQIVLVALNKDIAFINGINVKRIEVLIFVVIALSIAVTIKIVGALLVVSLSIIPAINSQIISASPRKMIVNSIILALVINPLGVYLSFLFDLPVSPTIIIVGFGCFVLLFLLNKFIFKDAFKS